MTVFISFDRAGSLAYVDQLAAHLGRAGLPVYYSRETGGEQRWAEVVSRLQSCAAVVLVMTPGAQQSAWVTSEIDYARRLGKPILPLLLDGTPFHPPYETVTNAAMPSDSFVAQLRAFASPQLPTFMPPGPPLSLPPARPRRTGLIVGLVAGGVALVLVCATVAIGLAVRQTRGDGSSGGSWQEQAADIDGIQNFLVTHPEWFKVNPSVGNHQRGRISYPVDPPAGGVHNPVWQNCMGDVYPAEVPKEQVMHSLEHGAVWVTYRPNLPRDQVDRLAERVRNVPYTLMSPYPGLDVPISLQAWGYQLKVDRANDSRVDRFLNALRRNASQEPNATCSSGITDTGSAPLDLP